MDGVGNGKGGISCSEEAKVKKDAPQAVQGRVAAWAGRWCAAARAAGTRSRIAGNTLQRHRLPEMWHADARRALLTAFREGKPRKDGCE